jgi:hypothetical protein
VTQPFADFTAGEHAGECDAVADAKRRRQLLERPAPRSVADDRKNGVRVSLRHSCERLQTVLESFLFDEPSDHDDFDPGRVAAAERELAEIDPQPVDHQSIRRSTQSAKTFANFL